MEDEPEKVNASIELDADIHKKIKIFCVQHGINLKDWIVSAIVAAYKNEIEGTKK